MSTPIHAIETPSSRKKTRELHEARQSGNAAPEIDVKTGTMINPHNPEFITRRPWYLGGGDSGPSLDHQSSQRPDAEQTELSLKKAEALVSNERKKIQRSMKLGELKVGMWVEALKKNKKPYRMCEVVNLRKNGGVADLKYEDGYVDRNVKVRLDDEQQNPRIRLTKAGARSFHIDHETYGKETYDSKRDAYHGYEAGSSHMRRLEEKFATRDVLRRQRRSTKTDSDAGDDNDDDDNNKDDDDGKKQTKQTNEKDSDSDSDLDSDIGSDDDDEFVQRDEDAKTFQSRLARQGGVGGAQMKVTARNLRIREDTAKYLKNLDLNSAYYDPKSRSMRDNPNPEANPDEVQFAGDNFARITGAAVDFAQTQLFAWEAQTKGVEDVHPQANPSQTEVLKKTYKTQAEKQKEEKKKAVLEKYGGAEYLDGGDGLGQSSSTGEERSTRFGVVTQTQEYTRDGRLVRSSAREKQEQMKQASKYEEDVFINGHTTVWGSYFHKGAFRWGYADDHSLMKNSYCTGINGRKANDEANEMRYGTGEAGSAALAQAREMLKVLPKHERTDQSSRPTDAKLYGEAEQHATFDQDKLQDAMKKAEHHDKRELSERKRKYNSLKAENDVTEEDMEVYRMRKNRSEDPMEKLAEGEELLDYK